MKSDTNNIRSPLLLVLVLVLLSFAGSDNSKDKEECAESLVGLATCLPYVGGSAKAPTSDCCSGLKQLLKTNKKCLCVVIKDRNDPDLGLNINATLALGLPQACTAPANISDCPTLLKLSPDSPDAQIFYQSTNTSSSGPVANVKPNPSSSPAEVNNPGSSFEQKSGVYGNGKRYLGFEIFRGLVLLICYGLLLET